MSLERACFLERPTTMQAFKDSTFSFVRFLLMFVLFFDSRFLGNVDHSGYTFQKALTATEVKGSENLTVLDSTVTTLIFDVCPETCGVRRRWYYFLSTTVTEYLFGHDYISGELVFMCECQVVEPTSQTLEIPCLSGSKGHTAQQTSSILKSTQGSSISDVNVIGRARPGHTYKYLLLHND